MDSRNDEGADERGNFRDNRGCFRPGEDEKVCGKPGPGIDRERMFDDSESGSRNREEGGFHGDRERSFDERDPGQRRDFNNEDEPREHRRREE